MFYGLVAPDRLAEGNSNLGVIHRDLHGLLSPAHILGGETDRGIPQDMSEGFPALIDLSEYIILSNGNVSKVHLTLFPAPVHRDKRRD